MEFGVQCECGATRPVSATEAGSRIRCHCGRELVVPSLGKLKASAGQSAMSADVRIDELLKRGALPQETACVACKRPTKNAVHAWTVCERAVVQQKGDWETSRWSFLTLFFGFLTFRKQVQETSEGRDLRFRLPLRVCDTCAEPLGDPRLLKEVMLAVPLYAELLDKYPDAEVSLDVGLAGLTRREDPMGA